MAKLQENGSEETADLSTIEEQRTTKAPVKLAESKGKLSSAQGFGRGGPMQLIETIQTVVGDCIETNAHVMKRLVLAVIVIGYHAFLGLFEPDYLSSTSGPCEFVIVRVDCIGIYGAGFHYIVLMWPNRTVAS